MKPRRVLILRLIQGKELFGTAQIPLNELYKFDFCVDKPFYSGLGVDYTYMGELDKIGHKYGTNSLELIEALREVDKKISKMDFDIILSDHGMIDIKKTISVPKSKDCFIDADLARYWGGEQELNKVKEKLPLTEGKLINWPDKRFGQLIFIANPGVLIYPNFWWHRKDKAMHGYDGKHPDLKAIYILNRKGNRKDFNVHQLHEIFRKWKITG